MWAETAGVQDLEGGNQVNENIKLWDTSLKIAGYFGKYPN